MKSIAAQSLSDAFYLSDVSYEINEIFNLRRIQFLQKKYGINMEIYVKCPKKGSEKLYVPLKKKHPKNLCVLIKSNPETSYTVLENFEIIQVWDRK